MYNPIGRQMQDQRHNGDPQYMTEDQQVMDLQRRGMHNAHPPLELSPCVRLVKNGQLTDECHTWTEFFASRPDLCVNCDENGDIDPAKWRGRGPQGYSEPRNMRPIRHHGQPVLESQAPVMSVDVSNLATIPHVAQPVSNPGAIPGAPPPVETASAVLGVPPQFSQTYTEPLQVPPSLVVNVPGQQNVPVTNVVHTAFDQGNNG